MLVRSGMWSQPMHSLHPHDQDHHLESYATRCGRRTISSTPLVAGLIVIAVPPSETGSAMSFNQVMRYRGYCPESALTATILRARIETGYAGVLSLPRGDIRAGDLPRCTR